MKNSPYFSKFKLTDYPVSYSFYNILHYLKDKKTLDLGCGVGNYLIYFSKNSIGLDYSFLNIEKVKKRGCRGIVHDLNFGLNFKISTFNAVFMSHILEHVDNPIFLIRESYRVLKPKGILVLGLPIESSLVRSLGDKYFIDHPGHLYSFSEQNIRELCKKVGYKKELCLTYDFPLIQRSGYIGLSKILNKILNKKIASYFASFYWIIFQK